MDTQHDKLTRKGSKHAQPELRSQQIIDAAIVCFGKNGYAKTSIDDIGKQSKLSKGTVYRFFTSKDELLLSVIDYIQCVFDSRFEELSVGKSCLEQLEIFYKLNIGDIIGERELVSMWFQILNLDFTQDKLKIIYQNDLADLTAIVQKGIEQGEFNASAIDSVPMAMLSMLNGHVLLSYLLNEDPEQWIAKFESSWLLLKKQLVSK